MRIVLAFIGALFFNTASFAQNDLAGLSQQANTFLPVEEAYPLNVEVTDGNIRLLWTIADGYYLYKHRFKFALTDQQGDIALDLDLPSGLAKQDEFFGDVEVYYSFADVQLTPQREFTQAQLMVTSQGCADAGLCYPPQRQVFNISGALNTAEQPAAGPADNANVDWTAVLMAMGFALLGGVILNAMPCVFPILSLKVLSFAQGDSQQHHRHAWWYLTGVVTSFLVVAAVLIALQRAGSMMGWGFQLQSTGFVLGLAFLFTAMALSLSGVTHFGAGLMNMGNQLAGGGGSRGSFFTGVLAVVVASPCTAPFMGTALGFALGQPPVIALTVFTALGVGMALPMVLLSYSAPVRGLLPKPGAWMETFKQLMAFPLYITVVWLLWVAGRQSGIDTVAAALAGLVLMALALSVYGSSPWRKLIALACVLAALALATVRGDADRDVAIIPDGTQPWSEKALAELVAEGKPVFVDVTADWCITCLANERAVLKTDAGLAAFEAAGVVYMIADWTDYDPAIGAFVKSHGRHGIPLYVMYPANGGDPFLLPQLLTRSLLLEALERASL